MNSEGTADVVCPTVENASGENVPQKIAIVTATCEVQVGAQSGLGPVDFVVMTNTLGSKNDLTVNPTILLDIIYKETKDGIGCPLNFLGLTKTEGSYTGTTTIKGENPITKTEEELFLK